jgi:hypothetical protein
MSYQTHHLTVGAKNRVPVAKHWKECQSMYEEGMNDEFHGRPEQSDTSNCEFNPNYAPGAFLTLFLPKRHPLVKRLLNHS